MNKALVAGTFVVASGLVFAACIPRTQTGTNNPTPTVVVTPTVDPAADGQQLEQTTETTQPETTTQDTSQDAAAAQGQYTNYSPAALAQATQNGGKAVLFFKADWCPTCIQAEKEFMERWSEVPEGVSILVVNYDDADDLIKQHGVTYQHTFVQVDASGEQITKWSGGDIESLAKNIK